MPETSTKLHVRITTARGDVFSDWVDGAEIHTDDGTIRVVPNQHAYLSFSGASRICLRQGAAYFSFSLRNSVAHVEPQHLRIVAEEAQQANVDDTESARESACTT
jgi:F0F1-type ATP synthase epsilon subunit